MRMLKSLVRSIFVLAAAGLALAPARSHAQAAGPFVGVGAGVSRIAEPDARAARFGPALTGRAGWRFNPTLAVMLEGVWNGVGSRNPSEQIIDPGINGGTYGNRQLNTVAVLASVQFGGDALYVRPAIGAGQQAFTSWRPLPADGFAPETSREAGAALALAVGRRFSAVGGFPVNVEAVAVYTTGEDSSSPRWSAGVQLAHDFHL